MEDHEYTHNPKEDEIEHEFLDNITCPYCGYEYEYNKSRDLIGNTTTAWKFFLECKNCEKTFGVGWDFDDDDEGEETENIIFCTYHDAKVGIYCGEFDTLIEAQMQVMCLPQKHPAPGIDYGTSISYPPRED